jgi:hypothetical protein
MSFDLAKHNMIKNEFQFMASVYHLVNSDNLEESMQSYPLIQSFISKNFDIDFVTKFDELVESCLNRFDVLVAAEQTSNIYEIDQSIAEIDTMISNLWTELRIMIIEIDESDQKKPDVFLHLPGEEIYEAIYSYCHELARYAESVGSLAAIAPVYEELVIEAIRARGKFDYFSYEIQTTLKQYERYCELANNGPDGSNENGVTPISRTQCVERIRHY